MADDFTFTLVKDEEGNQNITVFFPGREPLMAHSTHAAWDTIIEKALSGDSDVADLFDIGLTIGQRLNLSDRVSYAGGHLFIDGDEISDGLSQHIVRMVQANEDTTPFVMLLEGIIQNPSKNSRDQLYRYIDANKVTITRDGKLVLYKYLYANDYNGGDNTPTYRSGHMGPAIVNGVASENGYVLQDIGDVVTMPRSKVADDPGTACSSGLHVGSWSYVSGNGNIITEVHVHPRDVVSVPRDERERKIRVCRYEIIGLATKEYAEPVLPEPTPPSAAEAGYFGGHRPVTSEATSIAPAAKVKHPSKLAFQAMRTVAKTKKKGLVRYATTVGGWRLLEGCQGDDRTHWSVS